MKEKILTLFFFITKVICQNCLIIIPEDPLNGGLFKPWYIFNETQEDECSQYNPKTSVFIEATILDKDSGEIFVYNPLVVNKNDIPEVFPNSLKLPINNIVTIHFGCNCNSLKFVYSPQVVQGNCINGLNSSVFGQFAYCNSIIFFKSINESIKNGKVNIPKVGLTLKGDFCPTIRNFAVVDQDQSDNLLSSYIITTNFKVAQNTLYNRNNLSVLTYVSNGSDNRLLNAFILPALSCESFTAPDFEDRNITKSSLVLNELHASNNPTDNDALIPPFNPMTLVSDEESLDKVNLYRLGVNMNILQNLDINLNYNYCKSLSRIAPNFFIKYGLEFSLASSPDSYTANNLLNFLVLRFENTWNILGCKNITNNDSPVFSIKDPNTNIAIRNNVFIINKQAVNNISSQKIVTKHTSITIFLLVILCLL